MESWEYDLNNKLKDDEEYDKMCEIAEREAEKRSFYCDECELTIPYDSSKHTLIVENDRAVAQCDCTKCGYPLEIEVKRW